jgi:hypothetical protein
MLMKDYDHGNRLGKTQKINKTFNKKKHESSQTNLTKKLGLVYSRKYYFMNRDM